MKFLTYIFLTCLLSMNILSQILPGQGQPVQSQDNNTSSIIAEIKTLNFLNSNLVAELQSLILALNDKNVQITNTDKMINENTRVRDSLKNEIRRLQQDNGKQITPVQRDIQEKIDNYDKIMMNNIWAKSNLVKEADQIRKQIEIRSVQLSDSRGRVKKLEAKLEQEKGSQK